VVYYVLQCRVFNNSDSQEKKEKCTRVKSLTRSLGLVIYTLHAFLMYF